MKGVLTCARGTSQDLTLDPMRPDPRPDDPRPGRPDQRTRAPLARTPLEAHVSHIFQNAEKKTDATSLLFLLAFENHARDLTYDKH